MTPETAGRLVAHRRRHARWRRPHRHLPVAPQVDVPGGSFRGSNCR
jgi:hypothetical protein